MNGWLPVREGLRRGAGGLLAGLCALALTGCASLHWEDPPRVGEAPDPETARIAMGRHAPARLQVVNSVLFEFRGRKVSGLGFLDADSAARSFGLACLAPSGVTLFELTGSNGTVRSHSVLDAFNQRAFLETLARDVERMFFDLQPPSGSTVRSEPGAAVFARADGRDRVEWVAGGDGALLEKRYYEGRRLVCRIGYYAPTEQNHRRIPGKVSLQNLRYGYGLTVTIRSIRRCD
jgi:hypothetical protein